MQTLPRRVTSRQPILYICRSRIRASNPPRRRFTTTRPRYAASPPAPPSAGYAALSSRRLISIAGVDAPRFLQGIITSNILALKPNPENNKGFYTGILNASGRVLHDVFIYASTLDVGIADPMLQPGEAFIIDVDEGQAGNLMQLIKRYKLRSKFKFRILDPGECALWQVWDDASSESGTGQRPPFSTADKSIVLPDTRAPGLGYRILTTQNAAPAADLDPSDEKAYQIRRYLRGVAEGQDEIRREQQLPLEANMDLMGGIDFRKGCYVGQELTIRTKHRGVVRKRILPVVLYGEGQPVPSRLEYDSDASPVPAETVPGQIKIGVDGKKGRLASTWVAGVGNVGLAVCRLQVMTDLELPGETRETPFDRERESSMEWGVNEEEGAQKVKVKAFVPDWVRHRLDETWRDPKQRYG
ncbi:uncharacterized protein BCR38DRAFT_423123 [Pseudomassariella vexata]|uniref:Iron-sulfur cluster assembly factor IBA57 homolog, mitochondrial n=1 Tax=Pseudomassariella vexata TaxID=1141098 RepID=A0A1Y2EAV4_9PEZI|nr:uncharacterized protein BCR38DRAFT_423123 [Pseudomassariella vexata]ORY68396.1 hypothetical protein BCR38DRAFT_423123 [Pseudomassariella vexata]